MSELLVEKQQGVPEGYKLTEVGVIPEDWEVRNIGSFTESTAGGTPSTSIPSYWGGVHPWMSSGELHLKRVFDVLARITDEGLANSSTKYVPSNSVLMGLAGQGKTRGTVAISKIPLCTNQSIAAIFPSNNYCSKYLFYNLESRYEELRGLSTGDGGRGGLNLTIIRNLKVLFPPIEEQTAIATALSDVDELLASLEALIAKKQAIKTATMQQLLSGRTRLPQFALREDGSPKGYKPSELGEIPEDWEVIPFGALFESSIPRKTLNSNSLVSFVGMQDVSESAQLINQSILDFENIRSGFTYFERGDVLIAKITPCFENGKGCYTGSLGTQVGFGSTEFHVLRSRNSSDPKFIYFWTVRDSFRNSLELEMVGSAGHRRVPLSALEDYLIPCPTNKKEQTAIATILSDMDAEIEALEKQLSKTQQIKQGMMQQLLTGKIRLVRPSC